MEQFNIIIRNKYLEFLKTTNMTEEFINQFDNHMKNQMINGALDLIYQGASKNKEFCEMGKTMIEMYLMEEANTNELSEGNISKLAIPKTKIKETIILLESLLNEEKLNKSKTKATSKKTKESGVEENKESTNSIKSKTKTNNTTTKSKSSKSLKVTNTVSIEAQPPRFTTVPLGAVVSENEESNLIKIEPKIIEELDEEEINKHFDMINLTNVEGINNTTTAAIEEKVEFNPLSVSEIDTDIKIDSQAVADIINNSSISKASPFNIAKRISNS